MAHALSKLTKAQLLARIDAAEEAAATAIRREEEAASYALGVIAERDALLVAQRPSRTAVNHVAPVVRSNRWTDSMGRTFERVVTKLGARVITRNVLVQAN